VGEWGGVLRRWSTIGCCWGWIDRIVKDFGRWADARTVGAVWTRRGFGVRHLESRPLISSIYICIEDSSDSRKDRGGMDTCTCRLSTYNSSCVQPSSSSRAKPLLSTKVELTLSVVGHYIIMPDLGGFYIQPGDRLEPNHS